MNIDIHTYPENADNRTLLAYRTAVQQAALDGKPIECIVPYGDWTLCPHTDSSIFDWDTFRYRVAKPTPAEGHNPEGFTDAQVGVGYRLLTEREMEAPRKPGVEFWHRYNGRWEPADLYGDHCPVNTYRTTVAPGKYDTRHWTERLPAAYRERAEKRYAEQPIPNTTLAETAGLSSAIEWSETREGHGFWRDVLDYLDGNRDTLPPLPPEPSFALWTLETMPMPCALRHKHPGANQVRFLPVFATAEGVAMGSRIHGQLEHPLHTWKDLFEKFEHSTDGGRTWEPCGFSLE